jgi:hypothetical protein
MEHIAFPEIQQFRNTIKLVRERAFDLNILPPTLTFVGTVKLHGTNASVVFPAVGGYYCQSRSQIITPENDNAGFARWVSENIDKFARFLSAGVVVYGEWCGQGIQKGVAISQVPKNFIVFAVQGIETGIYMNHYRIRACTEFLQYSIYDYPYWELDIDFNRPEDIQNKLVELTNAVEAECPVAKAFGVSGVGEGIVWWPMNNPNFNVHGLAFKVKGEKHSETKVKTLAAVDVEKLATIRELVDSVLTEHRLEKRIDALKEQGLEVDIKNTGAFLKLVGTDVYKEEKDTIEASGIPVGDVMGAVQKKAKQWWMEKVK